MSPQSKTNNILLLEFQEELYAGFRARGKRTHLCQLFEQWFFDTLFVLVGYVPF